MRSSRRERVGTALRRSAPPIAALSALAVSQPLLDLFGRNPSFFVAQDLSTVDIVVFGVLLTLGVPLAGISIVAVAAAVSERAAKLAHGALVGLLAGTFGLVLFGRDQTSVLVAAVLAVAAGTVVVVVEDRYEWFRSTLRYLAVLPVLVLALFLFGSESARLVWSPEASAAPADVVGSPAPVSVLVFDELPLASLLGEDGTINAERFPNFARLADEGTWYRNATTPLPRTEAAVPTILSGTVSPGAIPSSIDYPRNLFTLLADSHTINAEEEVTALCPEFACGAEAPAGSAAERARGAIADAAVVYGHRVLPEPTRDDLPPVNRSWGDFGADGEGADDVEDPFAARRDDPRGTQTQVGKLAYFDRMIEAIPDAGGPSLNVAHGVFPHSPWSLTPDGRAYGAVNEGLDFTPRLVWDDDVDVVVRGQMQHLLQLGQADAAVGRLIDRLEATGQWDESLVVVAADHGAAFEPGGLHREPGEGNLDAIFRVPMFVKYPGRAAGVIDDQPAQTSDLVPSIVEALDAEVDWTFDGIPLSEDRSDRVPTAILRDGSEIDLDPSVEPLLELARRYHERFPHRADWLGVVAVGEHGAHVGTAVDDLDPAAAGDWSWSTDRAADFDRVEDGYVPIQFEGTVSGPAGADDPGILLAVNGTVAGVGTQVTEGDDEGTWSFSTIVSHELFVPGENDVDLLVEDPTDPGSFLAVPSAGTAHWSVTFGADGRPESVQVGEEVLPVVDDGEAEARRLDIEAAFTDGRAVVVDGWAADIAAAEAPDGIALIVDGERVSSGVDPYPALAEPTGELAEWGFRLSVPDAALDGVTEGTVLTLFDDVAIAVPVSWDG